MSMVQGGSWYTYAYVYDGLGQIVGLIDETPGSATLGQEVATYTYDAWGNLLSHTDTSGTGVATSNPFLYKGYWYDWSTGLYDLNARYYNPALGRFLSVDPVGAQVGSGAPGYNGYAYASNNPVNRVDPSGMFDETVSGGGGAGPGGIGGAINSGDQIAKSVDENLVGTTSGIAQNEIVPVSLQVDQLINNMDGNGFINEGMGEVMSSSQAAQDIYKAERKGTALIKSDAAHRSGSFLSEEQLAEGKTFNITGGDGVQRTLLQVRGGMNGKSGIFEYLLGPDGQVSHQRFIPGGVINGIINQVVK